MNAVIFKRFKIRSYEVGLIFRDGEFTGLLKTGTHWFSDWFNKLQVEIVTRRTPWLVHEKLDLIIKSGFLGDEAIILDLKDHERGLVWIENRFSQILPAGQFVYWLGQKTVRAEILRGQGEEPPAYFQTGFVKRQPARQDLRH